jgi:peroxiredoxin
MSKNEVTLLPIGKKAPAFNLEASTGGKLSSRDLEGRFAVIVFHPKNNTPG